MKARDVHFRKATSKRSVGIVERFNQTLVERLFSSQDASDMLTLNVLPLSRSYV